MLKKKKKKKKEEEEDFVLDKKSNFTFPFYYTITFSNNECLSSSNNGRFYLPPSHSVSLSLYHAPPSS
jgi:hypothetical protein